MSAVYNYLRDGGMILRIKPSVTNCNTLKVFPTFDAGLKHLLTVANGTGTGQYTGNELIQIIANSVNNFYFDHWNDPASVVTDVNAGTTTVTMPFLDCTVTATFLPYRTLTVNNGTGSNTLLKPGDVRQIIANAPAQNYVFDNWTGDTAYLSANTETANITMPSANIILTANYKLGLVFSNVVYGYLYTGYAARDSRNLANTGWRVPTRTDLDTLINAYGGYILAGEHLKQSGTTTWQATNVADNSSGFSMVGAGNRFSTFSQRGTFGGFYTQSSFGDNPIAEDMYSCSFSNNGVESSNATNWLCFGISARLIKEDSNDPNFYTGNDGKIYRTIKIGNQVWTLENLAETKWRTGEIILNNTANASWSSRGVPAARCAWNNNDNNL